GSGGCGQGGGGGHHGQAVSRQIELARNGWIDRSTMCQRGTVKAWSELGHGGASTGMRQPFEHHRSEAGLAEQAGRYESVWTSADDDNRVGHALAIASEHPPTRI